MLAVSVDLICPACRSVSEGGARIDLRTLDRAGDVLRCECGREYPIIDGVPIVLADLASYLAAETVAVVEREPPEVAARLAAPGPDDAPYPRLLEHLSIYLDAHWGDRSEPVIACGVAAVLDKLAGLSRVDTTVELGCSVGRVLAELARTATWVVGMDLQFAAVRRARRLLAGERLPYCRRMMAREYATAAATGIAASNVELICGNALDPPLVPGAFDRVVAINLLDSIGNPQQLLAVLDGLCAPGGELVIASPYSYQSSILGEHAAIGPAELRARLAGRYRIEDAADLPWMLRRDARSALTYQIDYVRARKL
jgi:SAM-dependent methyltransferase/uncharacterized protein YbaR (Trm112 family)